MQLLLLKILTLINLGILVMELDFDRDTTFSFSSGRFGQNVSIFGVAMSGSTHIDNKKKTY